MNIVAMISRVSVKQRRMSDRRSLSNMIFSIYSLIELEWSVKAIYIFLMEVRSSLENKNNDQTKCESLIESCILQSTIRREKRIACPIEEDDSYMVGDARYIISGVALSAFVV